MTENAGKETAPRKIWKNLRSRVFTAIILVLVTAVPFYLGGVYWAVFCAVIGVQLLREWHSMLAGETRRIGLAVGGFGLVAAVIWLLQGNLVLLSVLTVFVAILAMIIAAKDNKAAWSGFGFLYITLPLLMIIALRGHDAGWGSDGLRLILFIILAVICADIGAYFGGSYFKGPKMAPKLSPNKTWSGFISGIAVSFIVAGMLAPMFGLSPFRAVILAVPIAVLSVVGDFLESGIKRRLGVKDAGNLLPGHGGLLDRLDSLLFVMFVFGGSLILIPSIWPV